MNASCCVLNGSTFSTVTVVSVALWRLPASCMAASDSVVRLSGSLITVLGSVRAGATQASDGSYTWTGQRGLIDIVAMGGLVVGSSTVGGNLWASGRVNVSSSPDTRGVGIEVSTLSSIRADASGQFGGSTATLTEGANDGRIQLSSDGDIWLLAALGAWTGPAPLPGTVLLGALAGLLYAGLLKTLRRWPEDGYIPFGPALMLGAALHAGLGVPAFLRP